MDVMVVNRRGLTGQKKLLNELNVIISYLQELNSEQFEGTLVCDWRVDKVNQWTSTLR